MSKQLVIPGVKESVNIIKSPLNYIGGKTKLLRQIVPIFPSNIETFVDLFAGGCNVGINVRNAKKILFNDNLKYLVDMYQAFMKKGLDGVLLHVESQIINYGLSKVNREGYNKLREDYNNKRNPLDLFVLIAYSFNHQIRFNNSHKFNNPFGKNRSSYNARMKKNLSAFITQLKSIKAEFSCIDFELFSYGRLSTRDFVYCDPPYLITTGTYNDGKRGFKGWSEKEEKNLLGILNRLDDKGIRFALSNVLEHKGKKNTILEYWLSQRDYEVHYLNFNYKNSNYQSNNKGKSIEVLITNY